MLELRGVVKHYATGAGEVVRAVDGASLRVGGGEFVAVYGPSGSGKTTLLLLAAALLAPDAGSVWFAGRDIGQLSTRDAASYRRRDVGFVFQSFHLMPAASALENAALKLLAEGMSLASAERRARPWLERVGLTTRAEHTPRELSKGECQRVAIARALANDPHLLLADEPTGNLDTQRSRETLGLMRELCDERRIPILLVTHDSEALEFVDRTCTLRDGTLSDGVDAELLRTASR